MKIPGRKLALRLLVVAGCAGVALIGRDLKLAARRCQELYAITLGSQLENQLGFDAGLSRRRFLYAIATTDRHELLQYVEETHTDDEKLRGDLRKLRMLSVRVLKDSLDHFDEQWRSYQGLRDRIVSGILEGRSAEFMKPEMLAGRTAADSASSELQQIKALLARHAEEKATLVDQTLLRCAVEIILFLAIIGGILAALLRSNLQRDRAFAALNTSHKELAAAREQEHRRSEILEMIGKHAALPDTLEAVVNLVPRVLPEAGAAIWVAAEGGLRLRAWANIPTDILEELKRLAKPQDLSREDFFSSAWLQDAAGKTIGAIKVYAPAAWCGFSAHAFSEIARLASLVIENRLLYDRLAFQAQHDVLTELPNRMLFRDRLQHAIRLAQRNAKRVAVLWLDLDRYKQVNDTLGHRAGDELLCQLARRLTAAVRASDTVARVGGDEFSVVLGDIESAAGALKVADKLMEAIAVPFNLFGHEAHISASCGISIYPEHGTEVEDLVRNADLAMYSAKNSGRKACQVFLPGQGESLKLRHELETDLAAAVPNEELELEYQPVVDADGAVQGLEALVRWRHPGKGAIPPADFIPLAEGTGLIFQIGEWVIRRACSDGARMLREGCDVKRIAVNVSSQQLARGDFAAVVARALGEFQFPAERLEFEIAESVFTSGMETAVEQIEALRLLGIRFSIDDFGAEYSSFKLLGKLPVDTVKIDRSFIRTLDSADAGGSTLVGGIIALAHSLHLKVIAEGVETRQELEMLQVMGCDLSQGFLLHRPMSPGDVVRTFDEAAARAGWRRLRAGAGRAQVQSSKFQAESSDM